MHHFPRGAELPQEFVECILKRAQQIWRKLYGTPRVTKGPRRHKGRPRGSAQHSCLAAINARHKKALRAATRDDMLVNLRNMQDQAAASSSKVWDDTMTKEVAFNGKKRKVHRLTTIAKGHLLASEVAHDEMEDAQLLQAHKEELRAKRRRKAQAVQELILGPSQHHATPHPGIDRVFIVSDVPEAAKVLECMQFKIVDNPIDATFCVAARPGDLDELVDWALTLSGGTACDLACIQGIGGSTVKYKAAVESGGWKRKPRYVWMSGPFRKEHSSAALLLERAMRLNGSMWAPIATQEEFADLTAKFTSGPRLQQRPLQAVGIISDRQGQRMQEQQISKPKNVFVGTKGIMKQFRQLDGGGSRVGS